MAVEEDHGEAAEPATSDAEDLSASHTFELPLARGRLRQDVSPKKVAIGPAPAWGLHTPGWEEPGDSPLQADHETKVVIFRREASPTVAFVAELEERSATSRTASCLVEEFETPSATSPDRSPVSGAAEGTEGSSAASRDCRRGGEEGDTLTARPAHRNSDAELSALYDAWAAAAARIQRGWRRYAARQPPPEAFAPSLARGWDADLLMDSAAGLQASPTRASAAARTIQRCWRGHTARRLVSRRRYQAERGDALHDLEFRRRLAAAPPPAQLLPGPSLELSSSPPGSAQQKYELQPGSATASRRSSATSAPAGSRRGSACPEMAADANHNPLVRRIDFMFPDSSASRRPSSSLHRELQDPYPTRPPAPRLALEEVPAAPAAPAVVREKNPLEVAAAQRPLTGHVQLVLVGHTEAVRAVDLSRDQTLLATGSQDCTVKVWDWQKQRAVLTIKAHRGFVFGCAFSPTGALLASCSDDETVRLWDPTTGAKLHTLRKHRGAVHSVQWARKEAVLASASADGTVRVWAAEKGKKLVTLRGHEDKVTCATFSADGEAVASASGDGTVRWWDWHHGKEVMKYREHYGAPTTCMYGRAAQDALLVVGTTDGTVRIFDTRTWLPTAALRDHGGAVTHAAFVADAARVVSTSVDSTVKVWDLRKGQALLTLHEHSGIVWQCAAVPDHVFSVAQDGRMVCTRLFSP
eukprot:EG_transcript_2868